MDLSKLSDDDLTAITSGDMAKVSDDGLQLIASHKQEERPSGYAGKKPEDLAWYQRAEKALQDLSPKLVQPGHELFSDEALANKEKALLPVAGAAATAAGLVSPVGKFLLPIAGAGVTFGLGHDVGNAISRRLGALLK